MGIDGTSPPHVYTHVCTHVCTHVYTRFYTRVYTCVYEQVDGLWHFSAAQRCGLQWHRGHPCMDTPAHHRHHRGHVHCMGKNVPVPKVIASVRALRRFVAHAQRLRIDVHIQHVCATLSCGAVWYGERAGGRAGGPVDRRARRHAARAGRGEGQASGLLTHNRHRYHSPTTTQTPAPHPRPTTTRHPPATTHHPPPTTHHTPHTVPHPAPTRQHPPSATNARRPMTHERHTPGSRPPERSPGRCGARARGRHGPNSDPVWHLPWG